MLTVAEESVIEPQEDFVVRPPARDLVRALFGGSHQPLPPINITDMVIGLSFDEDASMAPPQPAPPQPVRHNCIEKTEG